ncbi:DMT family transporter [Phanerochaete sordida]|uniref:DMT family transporter n=1 Tax=Phanerochaete sordida TaxID=48140 RepID=A0A9P3LI19_9APHY|nr:DMT family transporter [Phanerochaete sordida]
MNLTPGKRWPSDYTLGILILLVVVSLWTVGNFVAQDAYDTGFRKPFWVTYLNASSFVVYLVPYAIKHVLQKYGIHVWGGRAKPHGDYQSLPTDDKEGSLSPGSHPYTPKETFKLALTFAIPYFLLNWALFASLSLTSVTSSTILGSTVGIWTLVLGRLFRIEALTPVKVLAVATSFVGVVLVSVSDGSSSGTPAAAPAAHTDPAPVLGDAIALLGALICALYMVLFKRRVRDEARVDMRLFFGLMGALNAVGMLPVGLLLHLVGAERLAWPGAHVALVIAAGVATTVVADVLWVVAMMKTTPVVASVGQSLTMPLAIVGDFVLHGAVSVLAILGCVVVLASFGVLGLDTRKEAEHEKGRGLPQQSTDEETMEMGDRSMQEEE